MNWAQLTLYIFAGVGVLTLGVALLDRLHWLREGSASQLYTLVFAFKNKENVVEGIIRSVLSFGELPGTLDFEIVAVDDNSQDGTPKILDKLARAFPNLHVLRMGASDEPQDAIEVGMLCSASPVCLVCDVRGYVDISSMLESVFCLIGPNAYRRSGIVPTSPQRASR